VLAVLYTITLVAIVVGLAASLWAAFVSAVVVAIFLCFAWTKRREWTSVDRDALLAERRRRALDALLADRRARSLDRAVRTHRAVLSARRRSGDRFAIAVSDHGAARARLPRVAAPHSARERSARDALSTFVLGCSGSYWHLNGRGSQANERNCRSASWRSSPFVRARRVLAGRGRGVITLSLRRRRSDPCRPCRHHRARRWRAYRRDARDCAGRAHRRRQALSV
jgi:hypothetical protein